MSLSFSEQILHAFKRAERPVIVLKELAHVDDFASAFALASVLKKLGKDAEIVCGSGRTPDSLSFLKNAKRVSGDIPNLRTLSIYVNVAKAKVDELSYNVHGDELRVHIVPKNGFWSQDDVRVATTAFRYDLILLLGAQDIQSVGKLTEAYADFFYETPVMNIDHNPSNEHFGQYNVIDVGATSVGEVLYTLFERIDSGLLDEDIATSLLTGMIAKTKSFRTANVTPKTLATASSLISKGAKRDEIVERLYRTRSVETLRLWGRALTRLKSDANKGLVWTSLTRQDFAATSATEDALQDIVSELLSTAPDAKIVAIFYEHAEGYTAARLYAERPLDALALGAPFKASGTREHVHLVLPEKDVVTGERTVISHLKTVL